MRENSTDAPEFVGKHCDEVLCRQFWFEGELRDEAETLYFHTDNRWHQLYFDDMGRPHWGIQSNRPLPGGSPNEEAYYPLQDPGTDMGLKGAVIEDANTTTVPHGHAVAIRFSGRGLLKVTHQDGRTRLEHTPERSM